MLKRCLSLMLAVCLLLSISSVAFMEEDVDAALPAEAEIVTEPSDSVVEDTEVELNDETVNADADGEALDAAEETPVAAEAPETPAAAEEAPAPEAVAETVVEASANVLAEASTSELVLTSNAKRTISKGDQLQLNLNGQTAASFKSSKKGVATVSGTGLITAVRAGKAKIVVTLSTKKKLTLTLTVVDPTVPTKVHFTKDGSAVSGTITVNKGQPITLVPVAEPAGTAVTGFKWSSSKKAVAKVSSTGVVTPKKNGTTTITVTTTRGKKKAKLKIRVIDPYKATKVNLEPAGFSYMTVGGTLQLTATMEPSYSTSTLKWSTSNKKVATVTQTGLVRAKKKGKAKITVKTSSGKSARITIQVLNKGGNAKSLFIDMVSDEYLYVNELKYIRATTDPINASADVAWSSDNPSIVEIKSSEQSGDLSWIATVVPKAAGNCVITATDKVTGISSSVRVTVLEPPQPESISFPGLSGTVVMSVGEKRDIPYQVNPSTSLSHTWNRAIVFYDENILSIEYAPNNADRNCLGTMDYKLHITAKQPGTTTVRVALRGNLSIQNEFTLTVK